ncbi:uncharacterized protein LOC130956783 [Arachis stenosperma]|uniref:uncharacterized protein LOC130956783 n=1 Tax=Arachis stenosperma TaxID=217475 RepID=UPI0025AB7F9C|nr:uncharacterized protein LOC130956783 [Arachis stenosperma]
MASNNSFIVVLVYPNCRMRNSDNRVTFEYQDPILFPTQRVETLSDLKSLILSKLDGTQAREIGRVGYRLLAPMGNGVFRFRLFRLHGDEHVRLMFDIHGRIMCEQVMELSASLDLDAMHERTPIFDTSEVNYNLDDGVEFRVKHMFRSREAVLQGVKNYSICGSAEYRVIESDRLKYHVQRRQADSGCQWSLRVALRQNLGYGEVRSFGGPHSCLAPTMSQDHCQLDSSLICRVILPLIQSNPSVSIPIFQAAVQAMQICFRGTICDLRIKSYYNGHLMVRYCSMFDKVFWAFSSYVEAFKHCKPFVSVDGTHLFGKYGRVVLLIVVPQDGNINILPIAFAIIESENTESWSFFLTNLRCHVTPQDGLLVISDRSQAIKATLSSNDSGWHPLRAFHAYCIRHMAANFMSRFKSAEGKRYLINAAYSPSQAGFEWYMDALRGVSPAMADWADHFKKEIWLQHYDSGRRFGHMNTNLSECINAVLKGTRYLPISAIVRITYERLQKFFVTKGKEAQS